MNEEYKDYFDFVDSFSKRPLLKGPYGTIPADSILIYSLQEAMIEWEPEAYEDEDVSSDLDFNRESRVRYGPKVFNNIENAKPGFDLFEYVLIKPRYYNSELNRQITKNADKNFQFLYSFIDQANGSELGIINTVIYTVLNRTCHYLHSPSKEKFPIFKVIIEILMAGGIPVSWTGKYLLPSESTKGTYELVESGSFVVYWPYEDDPEFSKTICKI